MVDKFNDCFECGDFIRYSDSIYWEGESYCRECYDALSEEASYNDNPERYFCTDRR